MVGCLDTPELVEVSKQSTSILFSTPGTAKTPRLLNVLNKKYGFYTIPPGVPRWSLGLGNSISLRPVRSNASEDNCSLQEALDATLTDISQRNIWHCSETIVIARLIVVDNFLKFSSAYQAHLYPQTWL